MAWKELKVRITGDAPLVMHNGQTVDPLNKFSKMMGQIHKKRDKTDADHEEMAKIEFLAGLYLDENGHPIIPSNMIEAVIVSGARKTKNGKIATSGTYVEKDALLEYDGPKDAEGLLKDERFRMVANVRIQRNQIVRHRPKFDKWSLVCTIMYDDVQVEDKKSVIKWLDVAGATVGMGDWRPKFGRFSVKEE